MTDPGSTSDDERFFLSGGRRWRRTDPSLPEDVRARLMSYLGRGRSGVRTSARGDDGAALPRARRTVQLAKEGLGERGTPWWEQSEAQRAARWTAALKELDALHPKRPDVPEARKPGGPASSRPTRAASPRQEDDGGSGRPSDG